MQLTFSNSFKKTFAGKVKRNKELEEKFWLSVEIFIQNPFDPRLRTHKLSGKLKELWSFSIEYDLRVIFFFDENHTKAIFVDFGRHDEVY